MGLLLKAEQVLDRGACARDTDAPLPRVSLRDVDAVEEIDTAFGELTRRGEAAGAREQQRDPLFARRCLREQPQRGCEPAGRAGGCEARGRLAGLAQDRDGGQVAVPCRALDVVRASRRCRPLRRKPRGAPLVRSDSPAAPRRLVDRPSDERVPETKAPWHVRLSDQTKLQELVDRVQRRCLGRLGRVRCQVELEWIARHRGSLQHEVRDRTAGPTLR
jgi:hypothetical protein